MDGHGQPKQVRPINLSKGKPLSNNDYDNGATSKPEGRNSGVIIRMRPIGELLVAAVVFGHSA